MFAIISRWIQQLFYPGEKLELSYSKLKTYLECPYRYKLVYVRRFHAPPNPYSSLGHSIHKALELFYTREGKTLDDLIHAYHDGWEHEGYGDSIQAMEFFERGENILKRFYDNECKQEKQVLFSEKTFKIDLKFCWLRGIIDQIERLPDGTIEVIDYKTHKTMWTKKAVRQDLQLTVYNLACREAMGLKPDILTYYFLSKGRKLSTTRTRSDERKMVSLLKKTCRKIQKKKFEPNKKSCYRCNFTGRCEHADKETSSNRH